VSGPKVTIDASTLDFYSADVREAHRLLDTIGISQSGFDEQLSISQRVAQAVELVKKLRSPQPVIAWVQPG
jgi:hypothetical protein